MYYLDYKKKTNKKNFNQLTKLINALNVLSKD